MTSFGLSVPSKTFLLGEYVVTQGSPALILTTRPRFILLATHKVSGQTSKVMNIHVDSPAGRLINQQKNFYQRFDLEFIDSTHGAGGLGASGAQFLMVSMLQEYIKQKTIHDNSLLDLYYSFAWSGKGLPPSGADLIAQRYGGLCYFYKKKHQIKKFFWPFPDLDYCLIHTGNKVATHHHLETSGEINFVGLADIVNQGLASIEQGNSSDFLTAIQSYAQRLHALNLVAIHTKKILKQLLNCSEILAAKGCGALGADVILIIFERNNHEVIRWLKKQKMNIITYGHSVEKGLKMREF